MRLDIQYGESLSGEQGRPPVRRECRGKFETDVDSFDTAVHWWKLTLKTKGMIHRGFGILVALSQQRAVMGQQER
jgi:hypothetical protein